jgi:hypothetical protein
MRKNSFGRPYFVIKLILEILSESLLDQNDSRCPVAVETSGDGKKAIINAMPRLSRYSNHTRLARQSDLYLEFIHSGITTASFLLLYRSHIMRRTCKHGST